MSTAGQEASDLAEQSGVSLLPWQRSLVDWSLGERADGALAASTVKVICSRQNGKNAGLEIVQLHDLVLAGAWWIHTAHLFTTTRESFNRLWALIEANPDVKERVTLKYASPMSGYEIQFRGGGRIKFIARSRTSGRGLGGDKLAFDEDQDLDDDAQGALLPVVSARPGNQVWYLGSAPGARSVVSQRLRSRGRRAAAAVGSGDPHPDPRLLYAEHSAPPDADLDDPDAWAWGNPSYGYFVTDDTIASERGGMSPEMFARERLSISPDLDGDSSGLGEFRKAWALAESDIRVITGVPTFAVEVAWDRSGAAIGVAGETDGGQAVEVVEHRAGTGWVVARVIELRERHRKAEFWLDPGGPAGGLLPDFQAAGFEPSLMSTRQAGQAFAHLHDAVIEGSVFHLPDPALNVAVAGAKRRAIGDAWAWERRNDVDMSPLVAVTVACWADKQRPKRVVPRVINLAEIEG